MPSLFAVFALCLAGAASPAAEAPLSERAPREIYVPFSDLHVLLEQQPKRVLLSREEYNDLVKKAKKTPETHAPRPAAIIAADYVVSAGQQRAEIQGKLTVDVLEDGLHILPLDIGGVGLQDAELDSRNAAIGRNNAGQLVLFVEGMGRHTLALAMVAPLETTAARQVLNFRLPRPAATKLRLVALGDVEVKGGADVVSRTVDKVAKVTRFELLPREGDTSLLMTLNSHLQQQQRAVVARSVLIDEVTQAYEKLHATVSLGILYRAVDQFRFVVPEGFEINEVNSPLLARWDVQQEGGRKLLHVKLREQTTETVVLNIAAIRVPSRLEDWHAPRLEPLDVVGGAAVFGLLVEDRLKAESLAAMGLIPIDTSVLSQALPPILLEARPGSPALRAVAAWYVPQREFTLTAHYQKPPAEMAVTTSLLLVVADKGQEVLGGLSLLPRVEKRFSFDVSVPAGWQVASVTAAGGQPLAFERYAAVNSVSPLPKGEGAEDAGRIRITVPAGIPVGDEFKVNFHALRTPPGWLAPWQSSTVEFPAFAVMGATRDEGAIAVDVRNDMTVRPEKLAQLTPLDAAEKPKYGLAGVATTLAYRYESPKHAVSLVVERTKPRLTARTFSFLRVNPDALSCHYELIYTVEEARTQRLSLLLPKTTPASVAITALDGVKLKEFNSEIVDQQRRWNVSLAEPQHDRIRLAVDFQQPLPSQEPKGFSLPIVVADDVIYQSGLMAVEGCAELETQINTATRRVDVGELADADYQPGRRLLGAFGFVGDPPPLKIDVVRHPSYGIYPAIVEECSLDTNLSSQGQSQTQARFKLRTKAVYLQVKLPAGAELWSAELDGASLKPQRQDDSILIDVPAGTANAAQSLQIVYAAPVNGVALRGTVAVPAPKLQVRAERGKDVVDVPLADLVWRLHLPSGYEAVRASGTAVTSDIERPTPAAVQVAGLLYYLTGGISGPPLLLPAVQSARKAAQTSSQYAADRHAGIASEALPAAAMPRSAEYPVVDLARKSLAERRIEEALDSPARLEFVETPLTDVIDYLKDHHHIEIQLDNKALGDVGIGSDTPVTKNFKDISLRSALRLTLRELNLTYVVQDEVLLITTPEEAESRLTTVVYPVSDLVTFRDKAGERWSDFDSLIETISSTVTPTTWDAVGGAGSVSPQSLNNAEVLVISQTQETHRQIVTLLEQLRRSAPVQAGKGLPPLREKPQEMGGATGGMIGFGGGMGGGMAGGGKRTKDAKKGGPVDAQAGKSQSSKSEAASRSLAETPAAKPSAGDPFPTSVPAKTPQLPKHADKRNAAGDAFHGVDGANMPFYGNNPIAFPDAKDWQKLSASRKGNSEGLAGIRSLKIDVVQVPSGMDRVLTFRSLGVEPLLVVTLTNQSQLSALAWGLALAVWLIGAAMTRQTVRKKMVFIFTVAMVATLIPLATDSVELAQLCNMLFYAACLLAPYYLLAAMATWLFGMCRRTCMRCAGKPAATPVTSAAILLALLVGANVSARSQAAEANPQAAAGQYVIQVVEPPLPVKAPDDAIILPYDPNSMMGIKDVNKLLVPYEKYVELWNRAHPDKKIETKAAPAPYALAGAAYKTMLEGDEYLLLTGQIEIDVFADGFVQVPLGLGGGVLAQAELDGKPARLGVAGMRHDSFTQTNKGFAISQTILYVSGKGRHKLELAVRLKLSRQGGWRVAEGVLPAAPATALTIGVPKPQTELRLGQVADRRSYETEKPDEAIHTALNADGAVSIQWRPKVAEGQVDHSLTAISSVVFDVQEDGLRLTWQLGLEFRRSQRDRFNVALPAEFLLEKVEGNNVRGWEIRKTDKGHSVEVALLQTAKNHEQFTLRLWRAGSVGQEKLAQFDVPWVSVTDAVLHNGQLTIRRSPLLEVRTLDRSGATRTDLPGDAAQPAGGVGSAESPLGIRPFEAYSFATVPFTVRLAAAPVAARISATVQTVLRIADYERSLESRILFDVQGRPAYQLQMLLPDDLRVDRVSAPGAFQYAVTQQDKRPLLTIYLATGQHGSVPVLIRGKLGREGELKELLLPRLEVRNVDRQQGDVAVQIDPAFDVDATGLKHCEKVLLGRVYAWLNPEQRRVTRLGLHYTHGDYAGTLRLALRKADVVCDTISNVRVTDRAIEETILLAFSIKNAGVREVSFLLPRGMAGSRISAPMLRQKTVEPVSKEADAPLRVRIALQDEVMDQLRILVENDRLLTPDSHEAPVPTVEIGRTNRRYVAIESTGRDLMKVEEDNLREMDPLGRQQKEWEMLKGVLGREMTLAYLVAPDARQPRLSFHTEAHAAVETVGARIGLAETTLVLDANGAYRAQQVLRMDNTTEQFLEIRLPEGAELWTARVAGEPVKPTRHPGATDLRSVRIPLLKTAPGDLSYDVVLKYGGKMPALGTLANIEFPLVHCENIRPDLSQVRLYVPEKYRWFDFGGTMRLVAAEADLQAGYLKFQTNQTEQIMAAMQQGDKWAQIRAAANLKTQQAQMNLYRSSMGTYASNSELQSELTANASISQQAQREAHELEKASKQSEIQYNRDQLNKIFQGQKLGRARNVVNDLGANWSEADQRKPAGESGKIEQFNNEWLAKNRLTNRPFVMTGQMTTTTDQTRSGLQPSSQSSADLAIPFSSGKGKRAQANVPQQPSAAQIVLDEPQYRLDGITSFGASAVHTKQSLGHEYSARGGRQQADFKRSGPASQRKDSDDSVERYKYRLERQGAQQAANRPTQPNAPPADEARAGERAFGGGVNTDTGLVDNLTLAPTAGGAPAVPPPATGLASLDFELPTRGALYRFTTPRGDVQITAWSFASDLLRRLVEIAIVAVVALVIWLAARLVGRDKFAWLKTRTGSTLLICLGVLSFFGGILPVVGLVAVVAGCGLLVHRRVCGSN